MGLNLGKGLTGGEEGNNWRRVKQIQTRHDDVYPWRKVFETGVQ